MRSLSIAATGMLAQQLNVDVISNNIANMNTTAFAKRKAKFTDLFYQDIKRPGTPVSDLQNLPTGIQLGMGVKLSSIYRINEPGAIENTGNPLDLSIQGDGYFKIQLENDETAYTRDGAFQPSANGTIVTHEGHVLLPEIRIPEDCEQITINSNGDIYAKIERQVEPFLIGKIETVSFINPAGLDALGDNLLQETTGSGKPQIVMPGETKIIQGALETSNINAVAEITSLISAQRAYEMNSKVIKTASAMMSLTNRLG